MKLRYQMRGLGIGIIVTALMMGVIKGEKVPLSDAEIKVRALELGMVESGSLRLSDIPNATTSSEGQQDPSAGHGNSGGTSAGSEGEGEDSGAGEGTGLEDATASSAANAGGEDSGEADSEANPEKDASSEADTGQEKGENTEPDASGGSTSPTSAENSGREEGSDGDENIVRVVIEEGVTSYSVCQLLEELGLVEDADSLDYYICSNNYSRSIQKGIYEISKGTEPKEIVRIIMGQ